MRQDTNKQTNKQTIIITCLFIIDGYLLYRISWLSFTGVSKCPQISRILFSTLANLKNAEAWIVLIRHAISNSSSLLTKIFGIIPSTPFAISNTVTFIFLTFLVLWQGLSTCLSFRFLWFSLQDGKIHYTVSSLFLLIISRSSLLPVIKLSETIQTKTLLRSARILRRVLETWGDLLSLELQWRTFS